MYSFENFILIPILEKLILNTEFRSSYVYIRRFENLLITLCTPDRRPSCY